MFGVNSAVMPLGLRAYSKAFRKVSPVIQREVIAGGSKVTAVDIVISSPCSAHR
jgi:hypothetical protein